MLVLFGKLVGRIPCRLPLALHLPDYGGSLPNTATWRVAFHHGDGSLRPRLCQAEEKPGEAFFYYAFFCSIYFLFFSLPKIGLCFLFCFLFVKKKKNRSLSCEDAVFSEQLLKLMFLVGFRPKGLLLQMLVEKLMGVGVGGVCAGGVDAGMVVWCWCGVLLVLLVLVVLVVLVLVLVLV